MNHHHYKYRQNCHHPGHKNKWAIACNLTCMIRRSSMSTKHRRTSSSVCSILAFSSLSGLRGEGSIVTCGGSAGRVPPTPLVGSSRGRVLGVLRTLGFSGSTFLGVSVGLGISVGLSASGGLNGSVICRKDNKTIILYPSNKRNICTLKNNEMTLTGKEADTCSSSLILFVHNVIFKMPNFHYFKSWPLILTPPFPPRFWTIVIKSLSIVNFWYTMLDFNDKLGIK